jgi:hypothetical protein
MNAKYASIKYMISLSAALLLVAALTVTAGAQHIETGIAIAGSHFQIETVPEKGVAAPYNLHGMLQAGVYGGDCELVYAADLAWIMDEDQDQPPEIRIMSRIIQTALADVKAPELPEELTEQGEIGELAYVTTRSGIRDVFDVVPTMPLAYSTSRGKVSGFYMSGYGYLFTINWPIRTSNLLSTFYRGEGENLVVQLQAQNKALEQLLIQRADRVRQRTEAGAGVQEEQTEEERQAEMEEARSKAEELGEKIEEWRSELEDSLIESLMDVMATYGHTLHQAAPGESITFIFEQNDNDEDNITLSIEQSELGGPDEKEGALSAIKVSRGSENVNQVLKGQITIMAEIIDAAFEAEEESQFHYYIAGTGTYFGGEARTQHIPGYGIIFRKNARMSPFMVVPEVHDVPEPAARAETRVEERIISTTRRYATLIGEQSEESAEKMAQHLEMLKSKTAEILATYGTTLTELDDSEWIGINFEVGSAAGLLQSGVSDYLVLVQMHRVREASDHGADAADWLKGYIVTNAKQE